jgi:hypothetical protein
VSAIGFEPGQIVATPGALAAFEVSGDDPLAYLVRHLGGDWGDVDEHDRKENELSREHGWRILSSYRMNNGTRFWIITEADRSSTCILLPEEY